MTPVFPTEAATYAFALGGINGSEQREWHLRSALELAAKEGKKLFVYLDQERVRLTKPGPHKIEHVRGLGFDVWASTHPRIPGQMAP